MKQIWVKKQDVEKVNVQPQKEEQEQKYGTLRS
jgi:hypothetical protein